MKRLVFALALLAVLAVPAPALAKEVTNVAMCGPDGCKNFGNPSNLSGWPSDGGPMGEMPGPAAFYELKYTVAAEGEQHTFSQWYVPSAGMVASRDEREGIYWMQFDNPVLASAAKEVRPFPTPEISAVKIGDRTVTENPASFLRLFTVQNADREAYPQGVADWQPVTFVADKPSPWTLDKTAIYFSPSDGMLQRGVEMLKLPDDVAADLRNAEPLSGGSTSAFPWRTVLFALLGALLLLIAASFIRPLRRRVFVRRAPTTA